MRKFPKTPLVRSLKKIFSPQVDLSRRDFVIDMSKAGLALGLYGCVKKPVKHLFGHLENNGCRIVVVGAGIAGLNCAYQLKKNGIRTEIFEGSDRVGGRIFTKSSVIIPGTHTEFGGEFIDSNHEDMLSLAQEFNLPLVDVDSDKNVEKETYFIDGRNYSESQLRYEVSGVRSKILKDLENCGKYFDTEISKNFDQVSVEQYISELQCSGWMKTLLQSAYVAEYGLETSEQSSLNFISMMDFNSETKFEMYGESDERYKMIGGNSQIIKHLSENLENQIKTSHRLMAIKNKGLVYELFFEGKGKSVLADVVILALPFSILRSVDFNLSEMKAEKKECIQKIGYGQNNKLLLGFKDRVWRGSKKAGYLFNEKIQNGWDHTHMQNLNQGAGGYTCFLGGKTSKKLENLNSQTVNEFVQPLNHVFPGAKNAYSNIYDTALWTKNPWSQGSYSCYKVGQWSTIAGLEMESIGNIHFAGEHCSDEFQGFMNGAAQTGRLAAEKIIEKIFQTSTANRKVG